MSGHERPGDQPVASPTGRGRQLSALNGVDTATLAAATSTSRFDHAGAAAHLARAVEALAVAGQTGTVTHFELLHALGRAHWRSGARAAAEMTFDEAWAVADGIGDVDRLARAALGGGFSCDFSGDVAAARADRCRAALRRLPAGDSPTKARLLADLAASLVVGVDPCAARDAALGALAMARRTRDPLAIGYALLAEQFLNQGPSRLRQRIAAGRTIIELAGETGEHALEVLGRFCLIGALLESGDPTVVTEIDAQTAVVHRLREPAYRRHDLWFRCTGALLRGDLADAERIAGEGLDAAIAAHDPDALAVYGGQISVTRWMEGRPDETGDAIELMWKEQPDSPLWPALLAAVHALTGHHESARELLAGLDPVTIPDDRHTLLTLAAIGEAATSLGDRERIDATITALTPYADRMIPIAMGVANWGPAARQLGLLSAARGDLPAAAEHLRAALALAERVGAVPWVAWCTIDLVQVEVARGRPGPRARTALDDASATAAAIGLRHLVTRGAALRDRLP